VPSPAEQTQAMPPVARDLDERGMLDALRDGLRERRVEIALQPIVSLPQRKRRYYESFSRVRASDSRILMPAQYLDLAERAGLITAIDNLLLFRCVQLVRRAQKADGNVGFFCNISASTLKDRAFFSDFVDVMAANTGLARNLIFEFSQDDVESSRAEMEEYIFRLGRLGFSFSIDRVHDLTRLDIPALAKRRFRYIKIDSAQMLQRKAVADGVGAEGGGTAVIEINVAALKRVLQAYGIELIAEKIESEDDLAELLGHGIDYGQGYLFGVPSPSRDA
jgi:cyclic-di-GMP phosphodiesterase TipF (flagellum assembly factor)